MGRLDLENPELLREWNYEKNSDLRPEDCTTGSHKKVWWQCDKGHEWQAAIADRARGRGCPVCSGRQVLAGVNDLATTNPELAAQWHPAKNGSLTPRDVTSSSHKKVWWQCEKGHEWQAAIYNSSKGHGCPVCAGKKAWPGVNDLATVNPTLAAQWHPTKNGKLRPSDVMPGSSKKVWWMCDYGHEWQATVGSRTAGNGCPVCYSERQTSFAEQAIYYYLNFATPAKSRFKVDDKYEVDIFLPEKNAAIEYDGWYWHEKPQKSKRDKRKSEYFENSDIRLIRVKEVESKEKMPTDEQDIIYCFATQSGDYLVEVLGKIFKRLGITEDIDIDLKRDAPAIYDQYTKSIKDNSLLKLHPDIAGEWHPTKNGNLTPDKVTASSSKKVWWKCDKGHEWQATVDSRTTGNCCPICSGRLVLTGANDLATINPTLAAQWHPTKNGDLAPEDITARSHKKVWWVCDKGHEWQATVNERTRGRGCPYCSGRFAWPGDNDLATVRPDLAAQWHPTKNGDLTPQDITAGSSKKVWWLCKKGHEWQATVESRNTGRGCPYCSGKKAWPGLNDLATINPTLADQWHPTKNGDLTPEDVRPGSNKKVWWMCDKGHEWQAAVVSRSSGIGCPICSGQKVLSGINDLATTNPGLAAQWHPINNGKLTPDRVKPRSSKKVWWQCEKGHEWQATIASRSEGKGCPYCAGQRAWKGFNDLATKNPDIAAQWHPTKNGDLTPQDVTAGSHKKVWWVCDKGHEWQATIKNRNNGCGCPICRK